MDLRNSLGRTAAAVYIIINVGGAAWAARAGESLHAALHVGLLLAGMAGVMWWRGRTQHDSRSQELPLEEARLVNLQQSVDAIAIEVERIGEAQRFNAKLQSERDKAPS